MSSVSFVYVNMIALLCYSIMLVAFIVAKKSPEIKAFILVLVGFMFWTGGSLLMRLQVLPGVSFWFYVSILALFSLGYFLYLFACSFVRARGYLLKVILGIGTAAMLVLTATGVFLEPPTVTVMENGNVAFLYSMKWQIIIPCVFIMLTVAAIVKIFLDTIKEKGIGAPGIKEIIAGCIIVAAGNMMQILPGNIVPWDTVGGILFAMLLMSALYKKRMFRLRLLVSRGVLLFVSAVICTVVAVNLIGPLEEFLRENYSTAAESHTSIIVVIFILAIVLVYVFIRRLFDAIFTKENGQGKLLEAFGDKVSRSLDTAEIMRALISAVTEEINVSHVYVCLPEKGEYVAKISSNPLQSIAFSISEESPCMTHLKNEESYLIVEEFKNTSLYRSMWQEEKQLFSTLNLSCIIALKDNDDIVGLILLSEKERSGRFSYNEINFLISVSSIASIAVKNASLYEQMFREARTDSLTGVYNYKYFIEKLNEAYVASKNDCLALLYIDLDDFKLYNQLYGAQEGDFILRTVAQIIALCVGEAGMVFRNSGKVFAVILPGFDGRQALGLARNIHNNVAGINATAERAGFKTLTVSSGICVSPHSASSAKELMENTDLAVYNAKMGGKNRIFLFKGADSSPTSIYQRAMEIIEEYDPAYEMNSPTVFALIAAIDAKDHYTCKHSQNVAVYSAILATAVGLTEEQVRIVYEAALLHDIGKISIPESILGKTSALTNEEYEIMKGHVNNSIEMIRYLPAMDYLIPVALGHHERWDGKGYPRGIKGEEIPISARCLAIADAFEAMTADRPYRKGMTSDYAVDQILKGAGTQFDPMLAQLFASLVKSGEIKVLE